MKNRTSGAAVRRTSRKQTRPRNRSSYFTPKTGAQLRAFAETMTDRRNQAILWMLLDSELRPSEILSLNRGQIRVVIADRRDTGAPAAGSGHLSQFSGDPWRKFTVGSKAIRALRDYMNADRVIGDSPALFTEKTGERMTIDTLMPLIHGWVREAKNRSR